MYSGAPQPVIPGIQANVGSEFIYAPSATIPTVAQDGGASRDDLARSFTEQFPGYPPSIIIHRREEPRAPPPPPPPPSDPKEHLDYIDRQIQQKVDEAMSRAMAKYDKEAEEKEKHVAFESGETLIIPAEQVSSLDRQMIDIFVKNPGTGPVVLFTLMSYYGLTFDTTRFLSPEDGAVEGKTYQIELGLIKGVDSIASAVQKHIPQYDPMFMRFKNLVYQFLPILLLFVQFSYIFFIFYDSYRNYTGGVCPGYDVPNRAKQMYPNGADAIPRILMSFIGGYFVVKTLQQLFLFRNATQGNHTDALNPVLPPRPDGARPESQTRPKGAWTNIKESWIFPMYCCDMFLQLSLVVCVFLCNLYIVFVNGVAARDMVLNVVMLDFILDLQVKFKQSLFQSENGKKMLDLMRVAYSEPPISPAWKNQVAVLRTFSFEILVGISIFPVFASAAMVIYGPICKPGPDMVGPLPTVGKFV